MRQELAITFCFEKISLMLVSSGNLIFSSDNLLPWREWKTIAIVLVAAGYIRRFTYLSGRSLRLHRCRVLWTRVCLFYYRLWTYIDVYAQRRLTTGSMARMEHPQRCRASRFCISLALIYWPLSLGFHNGLMQYVKYRFLEKKRKENEEWSRLSKKVMIYSLTCFVRRLSLFG